MWRSAIRARADIVTITSYNEWHEGTQIEPSVEAGVRYMSYDGAWGLSGKPAERAYIDRTGVLGGPVPGPTGSSPASRSPPRCADQTR